MIQLRKTGQALAGQMEGSVEEVDSGKESQFRSEIELVGILRESFEEACRKLREGGPA